MPPVPPTPPGTPATTQARLEPTQPPRPLPPTPPLPPITAGTADTAEAPQTAGAAFRGTRTVGETLSARAADTAREAGGATTIGAARPAGPTGAAVAD